MLVLVRIRLILAIFFFFTGMKVNVKPQALFQIVDHYTRCEKDEKTVGVLLGYTQDSATTISKSIPMKISENDSIDIELINDLLQSEENPILGFYSTNQDFVVTEEAQVIHENPILLKIDLNTPEMNITIQYNDSEITDVSLHNQELKKINRICNNHDSNLNLILKQLLEIKECVDLLAAQDVTSTDPYKARVLSTCFNNLPLDQITKYYREPALIAELCKVTQSQLSLYKKLLSVE